MILVKQSIAARFAKHVDKSVGLGPKGHCWAWTGALDTNGYGRMYAPNGERLTHRTAYALAHPDEDIAGVKVCHKCDYPPCCRPSHLFVGTQRDNLNDMRKKKRGNTVNLPGDRARNVKLTARQVVSIVRAAKCGVRRNDLARRHSVAVVTIHKIMQGENWSTVTKLRRTNEPGKRS